MTKPDAHVSYEWECFQVLAYELAEEAPEIAERKIMRRLRSKGLGPYDQTRVNILRELKNRLQEEITLSGRKSNYFLGRTAPVAEFNDYDVARMTNDLAAQFPYIPGGELERAINFAVYLYYVR